MTDLISRPAPDLARGFGRFRQWTEWSAHGSRSRREAKAGSCPPPCVPLLRFPDYGDDILRSPAPLTSETARGDTGAAAGAPTMIWNCQQAGHFGLLRGLLAPSDGGASAHAQDARDHKKPDSYEKPKNQFFVSSWGLVSLLGRFGGPRHPRAPQRRDRSNQPNIPSVQSGTWPGGGEGRSGEEQRVGG